MAESKGGRECVIFGGSLGGFEVGGGEDGEDGGDGGEGLLWPEDGGKDWKGKWKRQEGKLWGLREQVELCFGRMEGLVRWIREGGEAEDEDENEGGDAESGRKKDGETEIGVILIGHSVGAWIALELRRLWWEKYQLQATTTSDTTDAHGELQDDSSFPLQGVLKRPSYTVTASVLLTPTIIDIAKSPSGQLATPLLSNLPFLPTLMQTLTATLRWPLSESWLRYLVGKATGQTGDGLETTLSFLASEWGVQQALYLARDEMRTITQDEWGEEVWSASGNVDGKGRPGRMKMFFLFAKNDHWVADRTREEILNARGGEEGRQRDRTVVVDEEKGLVHAWCLKQSDVVARIVGAWLQDLRDAGEQED